MYVDRNTKESLRDYALRELRRLIINCDIKPGSTVSEQELADMLGVSRTPIREALVELSKTKILEIFPQRGCKISLIDYSLVQESIFVRTVIETAIFEEVCVSATPEDIQLLEKNLMLQHYYLDNRSTSQLLECDNEFHMLLYRITNKMQTYQLVSNMTIHFDRLRALGLATIKEIKIVEDHHAILDAIKNRNAQSAKKLLEDHIIGRHKLNESEIRQRHPTYIAPADGSV